MTTENKKKMWVVRSWGLKSNDISAFDKELEDLLNQLHTDGYVVYKMHMSQRQVVAYHKEPPKTGSLADLLVGALAARSGGGTAPDADSIVGPPKNVNTLQLMPELNDIMESRANGGLHTEERVSSLVSRVFSKATRHDIEESLEDMQKYHKQHVDTTARMKGSPCDDTCSVNAVLLITMQKLKALVDAKLVQ